MTTGEGAGEGQPDPPHEPLEETPGNNWLTPDVVADLQGKMQSQQSGTEATEATDYYYAEGFEEPEDKLRGLIEEELDRAFALWAANVPDPYGTRPGENYSQMVARRHGVNPEGKTNAELHKAIVAARHEGRDENSYLNIAQPVDTRPDDEVNAEVMRALREKERLAAAEVAAKQEAAGEQWEEVPSREQMERLRDLNDSDSELAGLVWQSIQRISEINQEPDGSRDKKTLSEADDNLAIHLVVDAVLRSVYSRQLGTEVTDVLELENEDLPSLLQSQERLQDPRELQRQLLTAASEVLFDRPYDFAAFQERGRRTAAAQELLDSLAAARAARERTEPPPAATGRPTESESPPSTARPADDPEPAGAKKEAATDTTSGVQETNEAISEEDDDPDPNLASEMDYRTETDRQQLRRLARVYGIDHRNRIGSFKRGEDLRDELAEFEERHIAEGDYEILNRLRSEERLPLLEVPEDLLAADADSDVEQQRPVPNLNSEQQARFDAIAEATDDNGAIRAALLREVFQVLNEREASFTNSELTDAIDEALNRYYSSLLGREVHILNLDDEELSGLDDYLRVPGQTAIALSGDVAQVIGEREIEPALDDAEGDEEDFIADAASSADIDITTDAGRALMEARVDVYGLWMYDEDGNRLTLAQLQQEAIEFEQDLLAAGNAAQLNMFRTVAASREAEPDDEAEPAPHRPTDQEIATKREEKLEAIEGQLDPRQKERLYTLLPLAEERTWLVVGALAQHTNDGAQEIEETIDFAIEAQEFLLDWYSELAGRDFISRDDLEAEADLDAIELGFELRDFDDARELLAEDLALVVTGFLDKNQQQRLDDIEQTDALQAARVKLGIEMLMYIGHARSFNETELASASSQAVYELYDRNIRAVFGEGVADSISPRRLFAEEPDDDVKDILDELSERRRAVVRAQDAGKTPRSVDLQILEDLNGYPRNRDEQQAMISPQGDPPKLNPRQLRSTLATEIKKIYFDIPSMEAEQWQRYMQVREGDPQLAEMVVAGLQSLDSEARWNQTNDELAARGVSREELLAAAAQRAVTDFYEREAAVQWHRVEKQQRAVENTRARYTPTIRDWRDVEKSANTDTGMIANHQDDDLRDPYKLLDNVTAAMAGVVWGGNVVNPPEEQPAATPGDRSLRDPVVALGREIAQYEAFDPRNVFHIRWLIATAERLGIDPEEFYEKPKRRFRRGRLGSGAQDLYGAIVTTFNDRYNKPR